MSHQVEKYMCLYVPLDGKVPEGNFPDLRFVWWCTSVILAGGFKELCFCARLAKERSSLNSRLGHIYIYIHIYDIFF